MFGLQPDTTDATVICQWGARAILTHYKGHQTVDVVFNRTQMDGVPPRAFVKWLADDMCKWLNPAKGQRKAKIGYIDRGGDEVYRLDAGAFHAKACANRSHGYLYIGAWMTGEPTDAAQSVEG